MSTAPAPPRFVAPEAVPIVAEVRAHAATIDAATGGPARPAHPLGKLPQVTALFWALKLLGTTLGETGGDQISEVMHVGYIATFALFMVLFLTAVTAQVRAGRLVPALFWTVIVATSAAGTEMADFLFETVGIGYVTGALALVVPMAVIWLLGRATGGSFSVSDIRTRRDEVLYWALILTSNTIGTGIGDGLSVTPLHALGSTVLVSALLGGVFWAYRATQVSRTALFWTAFVLTRPLGAAGGDLLWKPHAMGGLGLGRVPVSLALLTGIVLLERRSARRLRDDDGRAAGALAAHRSTAQAVPT